MISFFSIIDKLMAKFTYFAIEQVQKDRNLRADLLANLGELTESCCEHKIPITILKQLVLNDVDHQ